MPRAVDATSESEIELVHPGSTKKTYSSKKRRAASASESDVEEVVKEKEVDEEPKESAAEVEEEEEEEEEEYEIEKILDAKKGQFPGVSSFVVRRFPVITDHLHFSSNKRVGWGISSSGKIMEKSITAGWMREMRGMWSGFLPLVATSLIPS